ncbi:MAG: peptidoglycan DD-metalloendopeptidase family protein [Bacteroidota bacterium]
MSKYDTDVLISQLMELRKAFHPVVEWGVDEDDIHIFDLTAANERLAKVDVNDETTFCGFINESITENNCRIGMGGYGEDRIVYKLSALFGGESARTVHLGIDIWTEAGTSVYAPMKGVIHSFKDNDNHGDYGPTLILQHNLEGLTFYTLYGHLSKASLIGKNVGDKVDKGQQIATLGSYHENVHWPPHLHFQLLTDMKDHWGDFPGVCHKSQADEYLKMCPDPNLILNISKLDT